MNELLPYLKSIAESLKKMGVTSVSAKGCASSVSATGNITIGGMSLVGIEEVLRLALIAYETETEGGVETTTAISVLDMLGEDFVKMLHDAMFVTVTEEHDGQQVEVEKSVYELITKDISEI